MAFSSHLDQSLPDIDIRWQPSVGSHPSSVITPRKSNTITSASRDSAVDRKAEGSTGHHLSWLPSLIPPKFPRETRWKPARDAATRPRHGDGCCDCAVTTTMLSFSAAVNPALGRPPPRRFIFTRVGVHVFFFFFSCDGPEHL